MEIVKSSNLILFANNLHLNGLYSFTVFKVENHFYLLTGGSDEYINLFKLVKLDTSQISRLAMKIDPVENSDDNNNEDGNGNGNVGNVENDNEEETHTNTHN